MSDVSLRAMTRSDIPSVIQIEENSYSHPWTVGIFQDCIKTGYASWVLVKENEIIGYLILSTGANEAHLLNVCIASQYRRQGIAKKVLKQVIEVLTEKNFSVLFLEVRQSNHSAIRLYQALGFERIGLRKDYYQSDDGREHALTFKYQLASAQ